MHPITRSTQLRATHARTLTAMHLIAAVGLVLAVAPAGAATQNWIGSSGTWDDTTAANWSGGAVPVDGDTANLNQVTAGDLAIGYTAANLTTGLAALSINNSGGGVTTLSLDGSDDLPTGSLSLGAGGAISQSDGTFVTSVNDTSFSFINGGDYTMTDGVWSQTGGDLGLRGGSLVTQDVGTVSLSGQLFVIDGTWTVGSGSLSTGGGKHMFIGHRWGVPPLGPGLVATLNVDGGTVGVGSVLYIGDNGGFGNSGAVDQTGGTVNVGSYIVLNAAGSYSLSGGTLNSRQIQSMAAGTVFNHTGGDHVATNGSNIGATYNFSGGNWKLDQILNVAGTVNWTGGTLGSTGVANQTLGLYLNASGASWSMQGGSLIVNRWANAGANSLRIVPGATLQGYGDVWDSRFGVSSPGTFQASGRVVANGYGVDRTLDVSRWNDGKLTNPTDNTGTNGWFATDHGKLVLPSVAFASAVNWGEDAADTTIDLVNSARLDLTGSGTLSGALLATGRTDVDAPAHNLISVHEFGLVSGSASSLDLTIRYDDAAATAAAIAEADLKLFHYTGGAWVDTGATVNTTDNLITATGLTSFGQFGVGVSLTCNDCDELLVTITDEICDAPVPGSYQGYKDQVDTLLATHVTTPMCNDGPPQNASVAACESYLRDKLLDDAFCSLVKSLLE